MLRGSSFIYCTDAGVRNNETVIRCWVRNAEEIGSNVRTKCILDTKDIKNLIEKSWGGGDRRILNNQRTVKIRKAGCALVSVLKEVNRN